jgi:hypothetical protein
MAACLAPPAITRHPSPRAFVILLAVLTTALSGCNRKDVETAAPPETQAANAAEVTALQTALTKGMTAVAFEGLTDAHVGRRCVIVSRTPGSDAPPPPPLGMVRRLGATTVYTAEIHDVQAESLKIRAAYPTSGNVKIIEIPRADIQSIHVGS